MVMCISKIEVPPKRGVGKIGIVKAKIVAGWRDKLIIIGDSYEEIKLPYDINRRKMMLHWKNEDWIDFLNKFIVGKLGKGKYWIYEIGGGGKARGSIIGLFKGDIN